MHYGELLSHAGAHLAQKDSYFNNDYYFLMDSLQLIKTNDAFFIN